MGHYMPLTWLSLGWDCVMWGMSAWGYHLDNLLLHAGAALIFLLPREDDGNAQRAVAPTTRRC